MTMNKKELQTLIELRKRASVRRERGEFLAEGIKAFLECPSDRIRGLYVTGEALYEDDVRRKADRLRRSVPVRELTEAEFERVSDTKTPQGILAIVATEKNDEKTFFRESGVYVFLESVQDPGNVGTIVRSAEASGASGVVLNRSCADLYNPKTIRATMGSIFRVPCLLTEDMEATLKNFRKSGGRVYASHLSGSVPYTEADYRGLTAVLIGNESKGLSDALTNASDGAVRIPMEGSVESLNAAMAATLILYEAKRQRDESER